MYAHTLSKICSFSIGVKFKFISHFGMEFARLTCREVRWTSDWLASLRKWVSGFKFGKGIRNLLLILDVSRRLFLSEIVVELHCIVLTAIIRIRNEPLQSFSFASIAASFKPCLYVVVCVLFDCRIYISIAILVCLSCVCIAMVWYRVHQTLF